MSTEDASGARDESGTSGTLLYAALSTAPITLVTALDAVGSPEYGGIVGFSGVVRDHDSGREVAALSYSAHPSAEQELKQVSAQVADKYAQKPRGVRIWVAHRLGDLTIGDAALVCAVSAAHRDIAFEACAELVDRIKAEVPIWKEQYFTDGSTEWVAAGSVAQPTKSAQ